jgi:hypothetical protein
LKKKDEVKDTLQDLVEKSVFKDCIEEFEIKNQNEINQELSDKREVGKIKSEYSCAISGLKCYLEEFASDLVGNLSEDFFNIDAKPFVPKSSKKESLDLSALSLHNKESAKS